MLEQLWRRVEKRITQECLCIRHNVVTPLISSTLRLINNISHDGVCFICLTNNQKSMCWNLTLDPHSLLLNFYATTRESQPNLTYFSMLDHNWLLLIGVHHSKSYFQFMNLSVAVIMLRIFHSLHSLLAHQATTPSPHHIRVHGCTPIFTRYIHACIRNHSHWHQK